VNRPSDALAISGPLLRALQWINAGYAVLVAGMLVFSLAFPDFLNRALGVPSGADRDLLVGGLRAVIVLGLGGAAIVQAVLAQLRAIVTTVAAGDPFVAGNARRLQAIAWLVLAGEVVRMAVGAVVWFVAHNQPLLHIDIHAGFSVAPWLAVLLLFVLARVFADGTRMRADLEGTV
jgi:hypothetical protein